MNLSGAHVNDPFKMVFGNFKMVFPTLNLEFKGQLKSAVKAIKGKNECGRGKKIWQRKQQDTWRIFSIPRSPSLHRSGLS